MTSPLATPSEEVQISGLAHQKGVLSRPELYSRCTSFTRGELLTELTVAQGVGKFFRGFREDELDTVLSLVPILEIKEGDVICEQNDLCDAYGILVMGEASIQHFSVESGQEGQKVGILVPGQVVGALQYFDESRMPTRISCWSEKALMGVLKPDTLLKLNSKDCTVGRKMFNGMLAAAREELIQQTAETDRLDVILGVPPVLLFSQLKETGLLKDISKEQWPALAQRLFYCKYNAGDTVLHEGEVIKYLVILLQGTIELRSIKEDRTPILVNRPGAVVGGLPFMDTLRDMDAYAVSDCILAAASEETFYSLSMTHPQVHQTLLHNVANECLNRQRFQIYSSVMARRAIMAKGHVQWDNMDVVSSITRKEVDDADESKCGHFKESHSREDALLTTRNLITKAKSQMRTELISERREMYDGVQAWVDLKELLVDSQGALEEGMKQRRVQSEKTAWEVNKLQQSVSENSAIAKASLANATMEAARAERAESKCKSLSSQLIQETAQAARLRQTVSECVTRKWEWLAYIVHSRRMARNTRNEVLKAKVDECCGLKESVKEGLAELQVQKKQVALVKTELASEKLEAKAMKQERAEELRAHAQQISALKNAHEASKHEYESKLAEYSAALSTKEHEMMLIQAQLDELQQNASQGQAKAKADIGLLGQLCLELMGRCAEVERSTALQDAVRTDSHHKLIAASVDIIDRWWVATEDWVESNTAARDCILADLHAPVTQAISEDSPINAERVKDLISTAPGRLQDEPSIHRPVLNVDIPTPQSISHGGLGKDAVTTPGPSTKPVDTGAPSPQHQSFHNLGSDALPPPQPFPRNSGKDTVPLRSPSPHPSPPAATTRTPLTPRSLHQSVALPATPTSTTVTLNPHLTPPLRSPPLDPARPPGGYKGSLRPRSAREMLSHNSLSSLSPRRSSQMSTPIGQSERLGQSEGIVHFTYGGSPARPATTSPPRVYRPGGSSREMTSPAMSRRLHGGQGNGSTTGHIKKGFICRDAQQTDLITGDSPGFPAPIDPAVLLRSLRQSQANQSGRRTGRSEGRAETTGAEAREHTARCFGGGGNFYMAPRAGTLGGTQGSPACGTRASSARGASSPSSS